MVSSNYDIRSTEVDGEKLIKIDGSKFIDSAGGFLIDEQAQHESERAVKIQKISEESSVEVPLTYYQCLECEEEFIDSFLLKSFGYSCCDKCKNDDYHQLIPKTEAKDRYLLKDCDIDKREPKLRFISRKNPHKTSWSEMKLYLIIDVEKRAMEVHGSMEKILDEKKLREKKSEIMKAKKYNKQLKQLRMNVRSTLYDKTTKKHEHDFGPSTHNEEADEYTHTCVSCGYIETYEEL